MTGTRASEIYKSLPLVGEGGETLLAQVARDIEQQIALGRLLPGDRLPSERALAAQLGLSRNTVTAAYAVLEKRGVICRVAQRGAFVSPAGPQENPIDWSSKISRQAHLLDEPVLEMLAQSRLPNLRYRLSAGTPARTREGWQRCAGTGFLCRRAG
jgi:DNA-binding GntR family transcriptional regulator